MNQLDERLRDAAATVRDRAGTMHLDDWPLESGLTRERRPHAVRLVAAAAVTCLVTTLIIAASLDRSERPARVIATAGTTAAQPGTSIPPPIASLPVATEAAFPGLPGVLDIAKGYEAQNGPISYGEIVATTRARVAGFFPGDQVDYAGSIYLVRLVGAFSTNGTTSARGASSPPGNELLFIVSRPIAQPADTNFVIRFGTTDMSEFGPVYRLPHE